MSGAGWVDVPLWGAPDSGDVERGTSGKHRMDAPPVTDVPAGVTDTAPVTDAASVTYAARCLGLTRDERGRVRQVWQCPMCDGVFVARAGAKTCSARCRQALRRARLRAAVTDSARLGAGVSRDVATLRGAH